MPSDLLHAPSKAVHSDLINALKASEIVSSFFFLAFSSLEQSNEISSRFPNRSSLLCPGVENVCFNNCSCVTVSSPVLKVCYIKVLKQNTLNEFLVCFQVVHLLLNQYVYIKHIYVQYIILITIYLLE